MLKRYCLVSLDRCTVTSAVGWLQPLSTLCLVPFFWRVGRWGGSPRLRCWYLPAQISLLAQVGAAFFIFFLLTNNQPVFVFSSHSCVHTTWSENTLLSQLVNMLFLIYYLLPMGCISECAKQLFRFCSHNHVERNHRARCLALVLQRLCFPPSLCKIHPSLFYLFPHFHWLNN